MNQRDKIDLNTHVRCSDEQVAADVGGELAILNLKTGAYYGLDDVGGRIWDLLKENRTVREIRDLILEEYAVDAFRCEQDLFGLLADLARHELIEVSHASDRQV